MSHGKVKGTVVIETIKYLRAHRERALPLLSPTLSPYLEGRILPTSWHAEADYFPLLRASVLLAGGSDDSLESWQRVARAGSPTYFEGPYQALVQRGDPERSLRNFGSLWRLRHDTGEVTVEILETGLARILMADYALVEERMCAAIQGTLAGLLDYTDAKNVELSHARCRARGDAICEWLARWSQG